LAWAHAQRAGLLFTLGRLDDAAAEYRASLDAFPGYVHALAGLGRVAAAHEDWDAAVASYSQAIERVPLPEYVIALGDVYEAAGDEGRAQQQYDLVAAIQQLYAANGVNLDLQIAQFNADHNRDLAATVQRARQTYAEQPSLQAADVLAWCELKAGNVDAARAAIERALATGTRDPLVLFHAGMIYRAAGDVVRARMLLTQVHDQAPRFSVRYALALEEALAGL
jgi:tetratricopeptide (TPR) repeat protein